MKKLKILGHPNEQLSVRSKPIEEINDNVREFAKSLYQILVDAHEDGVGIAAPQVGVNGRLFIYLTAPDKAELVINPVILEKSEKTETNIEGCLSFPGLSVPVARPTHIKVRYADLDGEYHEKDLEPPYSIIFQHEFDHLEGVTLLSRATRQVRRHWTRKWDKKVKKFETDTKRTKRIIDNEISKRK